MKGKRLILALAAGMLLTAACACGGGGDGLPPPTPLIAYDSGALGTAYRHLDSLATTAEAEELFNELWSASWGSSVAPEADGGFKVTFTFHRWEREGNPLFEPLPAEHPLFEKQEYDYVYSMEWWVSPDLNQVLATGDNALALEAELSAR